MRSLSTILVFFLLTTPKLCAAELDPNLQTQLRKAIDASNFQLAESLSRRQLELLPPEDSIQRASVLILHGDLLKRLSRNIERSEEKNHAASMMHHCKRPELTDTELDLRADALKLFEQEIDGPCSPYLDRLRTSILKAWHSVCCNGPTTSAKVQFEIYKNGKLANLRVVSSSGCIAADNAALSAVTNSSPFYPLPEGSPSPTHIEFTFDARLFFRRDPSIIKEVRAKKTTLVSTCD